MVLDDLVRAVADIVENVRQSAKANNAQTIQQQAAELEQFLRDGSVTVRDPETGAEETVSLSEVSEETPEALLQVLGELPEESQELILEPLKPANVERGRNLREQLQESEGAAVGQAGTVLGATLGLESATGGQLESQQFIVSQFLTFLALEDVLGKELEVSVAEGVQPLLEQEINSEYRSKQADLADVVEKQLREKDSDSDYLSGLGTYGVKPEDVSTLEAAAISEIEPEELIETPAEAGVLVDEETLDEELDRAGISEGAKDVFRETVEQLPRTTRLFEEQTTAEELVRLLDQQVQSGETTPAEATQALPDDVAQARDALRDRFDLLESNARDPPTDADTLGHLSRGIIGLQTAADELSGPGRTDSEVTRLLIEEVLSELDGDLRTALGLGQIDEAAFTELASVAGLDQAAVDSLLGGEDLDDIALRRLQDSSDPTGQSVEAILGIGPARGSALSAQGIETVGDLAQADPERVAELAQVTVDTARGFVEAARSRTQQ
jgi:hypothetical protein